MPLVFQIIRPLYTIMCVRTYVPLFITFLGYVCMHGNRNAPPSRADAPPDLEGRTDAEGPCEGSPARLDTQLAHSLSFSGTEQTVHRLSVVNQSFLCTL